MSGGIYSLKSTPNDRFFEKLFMAISEFLPEICWEEVDEEIFSYFRFVVWHGVWTLSDLYYTSGNREGASIFYYRKIGKQKSQKFSFNRNEIGMEMELEKIYQSATSKAVAAMQTFVS